MHLFVVGMFMKCGKPYVYTRDYYFTKLILRCCWDTKHTSLWVSRTGSASGWCALQEALHGHKKCLGGFSFHWNWKSGNWYQSSAKV